MFNQQLSCSSGLLFCSVLVCSSRSVFCFTVRSSFLLLLFLSSVISLFLSNSSPSLSSLCTMDMFADLYFICSDMFCSSVLFCSFRSVLCFALALLDIQHDKYLKGMSAGQNNSANINILNEQCTDCGMRCCWCGDTDWRGVGTKRTIPIILVIVGVRTNTL